MNCAQEKQAKNTSRRRFIASAAAATLGSVAARATAAMLPASAPTVHVRKRPLNVLFFMSDDMRPELGCYSSRFGVESPNIDRLASESIRFDRNYCQFPLCNPSRSSMFTGHTPLATRVLGNSTSVRNLHPDWTTLPQLFRESGYTTLRAGKLFHAGLDDHKAWSDFDGDAESLHPTQEGKRFDFPRARIPQPDGALPVLAADNQRAAHSDQILILDGNGEGAGDYLVADRAIQYLNQCKNEPFFIGCGFSKPHSPPTAPQRFFDRIDPAAIELPPNFAAWPTLPQGFPKGSIRMRNADLFIGRGASTAEAQQVIRAYLASISWADWNLGRVMAELDRLNLRQNTAIVFVVDHGYHLGEWGKWSKAGSLFEYGTRIPLIIHLPEAHGNGRASTRIVQSLDIYRTLAELCHLDVPEGIEGRSLAPLLHWPDAEWSHPAFSIWSEDGSTVHGTTVRTDRYRYAEFGKPQTGVKPSEYSMLFDVHADPLERTNLADREELQKTRAHLSTLIGEYGSST